MGNVFIIGPDDEEEVEVEQEGGADDVSADDIEEESAE